MHDDELPPLPIKPELWARVLARLKLSPQQASVAELVVRGLPDSRIGFELGIQKPTVRTHLDRLFKRAKVEGRVELIIRVFSIALEESEEAS
jgi:DNA-binding NarL/FixJ family response regulator